MEASEAQTLTPDVKTTAVPEQPEPDGQAAREHEQPLRALVEQLPQGVLRYGPDLRVSFANAAAIRLMGLKRTRLTGKHVREIPLFSSSAAEHEDGLRAVLESGRPQMSTYCYRTPKGERHLEEVMAPELDEKGRIVAVIWTAHDVTQQKTVQAALVRAKEEATALVSSRERFLVSMSHELRTPLSAVIGFTELIKQEATGDLLGYAELVDAGARRLMETLAAVLELAQVRSGTLHLMPEPTDVTALAHLAVAHVRPLASLKGLRLEVDLPEHPIVVVADRSALVKVLVQLTENAVKFTDKGSVRLSARVDGSKVVIEVADTGPGIPSGRLAQIFEGLAEGGGHSSRSTGLGLAIAKGAVGLMGGTLELNSRPGTGTTVAVMLPGVSSTTGAPTTPARKRPSRELPRVLVVEDYAPTRLLVSAYLKGRATVHCVSGSAGALAIAEGQALFDVVLLDINLGEGDSGENLLPRLRSGKACQDARFVAMTAYALPGDEERFLKIGFDGYLPKPFTRVEFMDAFEHHTQAGAVALMRA